jgi:hypothetical protein
VVKKNGQRKEAPAVQRARVGTKAKELMLTVFLRNEVAFQDAVEYLKVEHLSAFDPGLAALWKVLIDYHDSYGKLPERRFLVAGLEAYIAEYGDEVLSQDEYDNVKIFIEEAYKPFDRDITTDVKYQEWAVLTLAQFLQELKHDQAMELLLGASSTTLPVNLSELYATIGGEVAQLMDIAKKRETLELYPADWERSSVVVTRSTGMPVFDRFLGGGDVDGEVYGLIGPFGSAKTTLAVQLAVNKTWQFYEESQDPEYKGPRKLVFLYNYETPPAEIRQRVLACAACIHTSSLGGTDFVARLSMPDRLKPYELEMSADDCKFSGSRIRCERERKADVEKWLNNRLVSRDFSGMSDSHAGSGGVMEIARDIDQVCRRMSADLGVPVVCGLVLIDYAGEMVRREMNATGTDEKMTTGWLQRTPGLVRRRIAAFFKCPCWLLHQLAGRVNNYSSSHTANSAEASGCASWHENLNFSFVLSKPNDDGLMLIKCDKHRRAAPYKDAITRVEGQFARVVDVSEFYTISPASKQIVACGEARAMAGMLGQKMASRKSPASYSNAFGIENGEAVDRSDLVTAPTDGAEQTGVENEAEEIIDPDDVVGD